MTDMGKYDLEFESACVALHERVRILGVPGEKIDSSKWKELPAEVLAVVPVWIPGLLEKFPFDGLVLEHYRGDIQTNYLFRLFNPDDYMAAFFKDGVLSNLRNFDFWPFADDSDGNTWVLAGTPDPHSAVYHIELSAWNPGAKPSPTNGLRFAASRMALLLSTMSVSEVSYYRESTGPHSLLWYQ